MNTYITVRFTACKNLYTYVYIYFRYSAQDIQCVRMKGNVVKIFTAERSEELPFVKSSSESAVDKGYPLQFIG